MLNQIVFFTLFLMAYSIYSQSSCPNLSTVDYNGKTYHTVQIGKQCWLKENLDVGTMVQGNEFTSNNRIVEKYCYDNKLENCNTYGGLYTWDEAMSYTRTSGSTGICPSGWHIPTSTELKLLIANSGSKSNPLKAEGQGTGSGLGTNESGFSAMLSGFRYDYSNFFGYLGDATYFWSSIESTSGSAEYLAFYGYNNDNIYVSDINKSLGLCVRCIMENITDIQSERLPSNISLRQNYPNPFNPETVIGYQISVFSHVKLKVYNLLGREVATLVDEFKQPGSYNSTFSIKNYALPSGIYFYTLHSGNYSKTKKMVLMK